MDFLTMHSAIRSIGIIGYGRFGRLLHSIFAENLPDKELRVYSRSNPVDDSLFYERRAVLKSELIIPAVPIRAFEATIEEVAPDITAGSTVMDVCSVKIHPRQILQKLLHEDVNIVCTHPMFGPATLRQQGDSLKGLNLVIENVRCPDDLYVSIRRFFKDLTLNVVEMDANEHDRLAAKFHFITLATASVLKQLGLRRSRIDTASATALLDFLEMISTDRDLVKDLHDFNPYCKEHFSDFFTACEDLQTFLSDAAVTQDSR